MGALGLNVPSCTLQASPAAVRRISVAFPVMRLSVLHSTRLLSLFRSSRCRAAAVRCVGLCVCVCECECECECECVCVCVCVLRCFPLSDRVSHAWIAGLEQHTHTYEWFPLPVA